MTRNFLVFSLINFIFLTKLNTNRVLTIIILRYILNIIKGVKKWE